MNEWAARHFDAGLQAPDFDRYLLPLQIHLQAAYAYTAVGRTLDAARHFDLGFNPPDTMRYSMEDFAKAKVVQGSMELAMNRPREALLHWNQAVEIEPVSLNHVNYLRAEALLAIKKNMLAEGRIVDAMQLTPLAIEALERVKPGGKTYSDAQQLLATLRNPAP